MTGDVMTLERRSVERGKVPALQLPDFSRPLFCVFGVTLDDIAIEDALAIVRAAAHTRTSCLITTPNLNFVVRAIVDRDFRDSIIRSDLNLVDGMPLVWAGRWFGVAVKQRVTGASLFERLRRDNTAAAPLKVFLFGGPPGVARLAAERLNAERGGVRCVGYSMPGYGSVADMSAPDIIQTINDSGADFLLVALGAAKGQAWIQRNRGALSVPIISHLGAVINFTAGTIERAPVWMQNRGLEWLWRILREPDLWRRYAGDAFATARLVIGAAADIVVAGLAVRRGAGTVPTRVVVSDSRESITIALEGSWMASRLAPLREVLQIQAGTRKRLSLDFSALADLDSTAVALLLTLRRFRLDQGLNWTVTGVSSGIRRRLNVYRAGELAV